MTRSRTWKLLAALALAAVVACNDDDNGPVNPPPPPPGNGAAVDTLEGDVAGTRTLSADTTYTIVGFLEIQPGAELIVPAGTRLESDPATRGSIITLRCEGGQPSGKLTVQGTEAEPVYFGPPATSGRQRGQAGGIVLHGCAPINVPGGTGVSEGTARPFGGDDPADDSGSIRYLTIEFGGVPVTPDNEINGLTLSGVGTGTEISFVQTHFIADDGFEWFGGTVHGDHLVSSANDDDAFDCDFGWNGTVQFLLAIQDRNLANRGVECDNDGSGSSNEPFTDPQVFNATWVGAGVEQANSEINDGLYLRRNISGRWRNLIITNFGNVGLVFDGDGVWAKVQSGELDVANVLFFNNLGLESGGIGTDDLTRNVQRRVGGAYAVDGVAAELGGSAFLFADPQFTSVSFDSPINGSQPDPRPQAGSPALDPANAAAPDDPDAVDPSARHLGAFSGDLWIDGWTSWETS